MVERCQVAHQQPLALGGGPGQILSIHVIVALVAGECTPVRLLRARKVVATPVLLRVVAQELKGQAVVFDGCIRIDRVVPVLEQQVAAPRRIEVVP